MIYKPDKLIPAWYVLYTKSRFEKTVDDQLTKKSIQSFLPTLVTKSKRKDRKATYLKPLFPGYIFVKTDLNAIENLEILRTAGVVNFIKNKDGAVSVPDNTIDSLNIVINADNELISTGTRFKKGDKVIVTYGPFKGITGYFKSNKGQHRVIIEIDALGQFAAVEVDYDDVEPVPENV